MIHPLHYSLVQCLGGESRVCLFTLASCHSPEPEKASEPKKFFSRPNILVDASFQQYQYFTNPESETAVPAG